jgi:hypothetical protein
VGVMKRIRTAGQWDAGARGRGLAYDAEIARRMAGGAKSKDTTIITGLDDVDQAFAAFEDKLKKKIIRQATRAAVKEEVLPEYKRIIEQEGLVSTGAMRDVPQVGVARVKRGSGKIGNALHISRDKLIETRRSRGGRIGYDRKRKEDFYYLAAAEYGTPKLKPIAPLRRALANATQAVIERCKRALIAGADAVSIGKQKKRSKRKDTSTLLESVGLKKPRKTKL